MAIAKILKVLLRSPALNPCITVCFDQLKAPRLKFTNAILINPKLISETVWTRMLACMILKSQNQIGTFEVTTELEILLLLEVEQIKQKLDAFIGLLKTWCQCNDERFVDRGLTKR